MTQRLYISGGLSNDARIECSRNQANYLLNVLRLGQGDKVLGFNGRDGEWELRIDQAKRKSCVLAAISQTRPQTPAPDLHWLFAPLKKARLDYMAQKATEMGAGHLRPVMTRRTIVRRLNLDRLRSNVIEAAEQCGLLSVPEVHEPQALDEILMNWPPDRALVWCDEEAPQINPMKALASLRGGKLALLVGPEGGFDEGERNMLSLHEAVTPISLGPRIMRADTAAVAALAIVQAVAGDWN